LKIKKKKHDIIFSKLVRLRTNWHCEKCGVNKVSETHTLDCAHIMGRRHVGLRWHPQNALSLCRSCHLFFTEHPFDFADWCRDYLGEGMVSALRRASSRPVKWIKADRDAIYTHMQDELLEMETQRLQGATGRLEFRIHELMVDYGGSR